MKKWWIAPLGLVVLVVGVLSGCHTLPRTPDSAAAFRAALALAQTQPTVPQGSPEERFATNRFKEFLSNLSAENVRAQVRLVYATNAWLNDTLKTVRGSEAIEAYLLKTAEGAESVTAVIDDVTRSSDGLYYVRWVMDARLKKVAAGETLRSIGITLVRFDAAGRVVIHQDYWDSAAGLFDHVPLIGRAIRTIKAGL